MEYILYGILSTVYYAVNTQLLTCVNHKCTPAGRLTSCVHLMKLKLTCLDKKTCKRLTDCNNKSKTSKYEETYTLDMYRSTRNETVLLHRRILHLYK